MAQAALTCMRAVSHDDVGQAGGGAHDVVAPARIDPYRFEGDVVLIWC